MPYYFKFYENNDDPQPSFTCAVTSEQCKALNKNGSRCSRKCVIGCPYCWTHLLAKFHLRILPSSIPEAGKGLFVMDKKQPTGTLLIKKNDIVCPYGGELIDKDTLEERYGAKTAPYAIQLSKNRFRDAGCARGVGSLINHDNRRSNVAFSVNQAAKTVSIKATRNVKNGEELLVNYGREYKMQDGSKYVTISK
jgi:hypothetical protein